MNALTKKNKLPRKKLSMIYISRKSNTANALFFYNFCNKHEALLKENSEIVAENVKSCGKFEFPTDPTKSIVIAAPRNKHSFKVSYRAARENLKTLM